MGCIQSKPGQTSPYASHSQPEDVRRSASTVPEPQGAPAYLSQSSWKSLESEATSKQSDDSAYVSHKGHRKLSPSAASTVHGYMAHSQTKYGAKRGASQDTELTSLAMPDVYVPPPLPSNEEARQATVDALGIIHAPANVHLYSLCRLAAQTFSCAMAWVMVIDREAVQAAAVYGLPSFQAWRGDRASSISCWGLIGEADLMVVEDMTLDLRFRRHESAKWDKPLLFSAFAPLVARNGHRIGYMLLTDFRARHFDASMYHLLANLAALAMQEIEAGVVGPPDSISDQCFDIPSKSSQPMMPRSEEHEHNPEAAGMVLICNAGLPEWPLVHCTSACHSLLGENLIACSRSSSTSVSSTPLAQQQQQRLWELFGQPGDLAEIQQQLQEARQPQLSVVPPGGSVQAPAGSQYKLLIHSPFQDWPARYGPVTGIPSAAYQRCGTHTQLCLVDVVLVPLDSSPLKPARFQTHGDDCAQAMAMQDIALVTQIGRGGYGKVYHGKYNGQDVAVKVITDQPTHCSARVNIEMEVANQLQHPHIIGTQAYAKREQPLKTDGLACGRIVVEHWIVMELCTRGSLQEAYERGWFQSAISRPGMTASPLAVLLATAVEIASGMAYLHERNILHGDLTAGNVLLAADEADFRGFTAKVADFGLSRFIESQQITTHTHGTVTHMPPELLMEGTLSKSGDAYAFGCLLWSMLTGTAPWPNVSRMQVMMKVTLRGESLQPPETAPAPLREIVAQCLHRQPEQRPTFEALHAQLLEYSQLTEHNDKLALQQKS